jgi:hypothetical protein
VISSTLALHRHFLHEHCSQRRFVCIVPLTTCACACSSHSACHSVEHSGGEATGSSTNEGFPYNGSVADVWVGRPPAGAVLQQELAAPMALEKKAATALFGTATTRGVDRHPDRLHQQSLPESIADSSIWIRATLQPASSDDGRLHVAITLGGDGQLGHDRWQAKCVGTPLVVVRISLLRLAQRTGSTMLDSACGTLPMGAQGWSSRRLEPHDRAEGTASQAAADAMQEHARRHAKSSAASDAECERTELQEAEAEKEGAEGDAQSAVADGTRTPPRRGADTVPPRGQHLLTQEAERWGMSDDARLDELRKAIGDVYP